MKTLTSFILGTVLMVGSALAAQPAKTATPAAAKPAASTSTPVKKVAHNKKKHSKRTKAVAKKTATPVTPVAAKK